MGNLISVPDRLVVLTFDDGNKSDYTFVAPLLKRCGFGATFNITEGLGVLKNPEHYMSWEEIRKLHEDGFEIANHTRHHKPVVGGDWPGQNESREEFLADLEYIEQRCQQHGIATPATFTYPGGVTSREAVEVLKERGYLLARRGVGRVYDPTEDHPLLVPSIASRPDWTFDDFLRAVEQATDWKMAVLTFHGVPALEHPWVNTEPATFEKYMKYLQENDYKVIALRDLTNYVDPRVYPVEKDPNRDVHFRSDRRWISPVELTCDYATNPLGIDTPRPRLSWILKSTIRDQRQSAYQILVASGKEGLDRNIGDLWDTGKMV